MIGLLLAGMFLTILLAYALTEYLLTRFDVRRRVLLGEGWPIRPILAANAVSFLVVWSSSLVLMFAADVHLYYQATIVCICAQTVWLTQHLWFYYRDHLRLGYE